MFYSRDPMAELDAVNTCLRCPVMLACREWALDHETLVPRNDQFGVWGGLSHAQRRKLVEARSHPPRPREVSVEVE